MVSHAGEDRDEEHDYSVDWFLYFCHRPDCFGGGISDGAAMSASGYAAFTLYFGAALHDASGDQRRLLRTTLPPLIKRAKEEKDPEQWKLIAQSMLIKVHQIMPEWPGPTGEWLAQIKALLPEGEDAFQVGKTT